ncbi:MAG: hypothetical protein ACOYYU_06305 [Chloroflexota bacterium]
MSDFTESIEQTAIDWLKIPGYEYVFGPGIASDGFARTLASLRDGLSLPRVTRGKIRVKEVEREL